MVLHQTVHPSDNSFDLAFLWKLTGSTDQSRLRAAIDHVIGEMTAFRTSYSTAAGELTAMVNPERPRTEILEIPPDLSDTQAERWIQASLRNDIDDGPFDLSSTSQVRCKIGATDEATYVTLHTAHIAGDVYACYEMLDAMAACYDSDRSQWPAITEKLREHPGSIPPGTPSDTALEALTELYADVDSFANADIAGTRTDGRTPGRRISFQIPSDVLDSLRDSDAYKSFGPVAVLYSAYAAVVHRICATDDFIVGIPMADRAGVKGKAASGFFVNTLPLPVQITRETTWDELLTKIRRGLSTLQRAKSVYPLTVHHDRVCPQATNQTLDNAVTYYKRELKPCFSDMGSTSIPVERSTVSYPIMVTFADGSDAMTVEMSLAAPFEGTGLDTELISALRSIAHAPSACIIQPDYSLGAGTPVVEASADDESVWHRLQSLSKRHPDRTAIRAERDVTYAELVAEARLFATGLQRKSASYYVVLSLPKSADSVIAFFGIMASGRVCVPVDPSTPSARFQHILETLLATGTNDVTVVADLVTGHGAGDIPAGRLEHYADLLSQGATPGDVDLSAVADTAYVIFTSGSTGKPKGVEVGHTGMLPLFDGATSTMRLSHEDTWIWLHSSNFDYSIWEIFCPLARGATLSIPDAQTQSDPLRLAEYLETERVTVLCETPAGLKRFGRLVTERRELFRSIRVLTVGGEAFSARELEPWRYLMMSGLNVFNMYGLTENTVVATILPMDLVPPDCSTNLIGYPVDSLEALCLDRYGRTSLPGQAGELHLAGCGLARGYLELPEETRRRFRHLRQPDGRVRRWLATGDRCRETELGFAYIGRIDNQIQLRGFRIELGDLESTALLHDGVRSVAAAKIDSPDGPYLALWYVGETAEAAVLTHLRKALPAYMVPALVRQMPALPTTTNGKTDLAALIGDLHDRPAHVRSGTPGDVHESGSLEATICSIWSAVTGYPAVLPTSRLFDIGGTSLDAVEIARRLNDLPRPINVDVVDLFEYTTPAELASYIEAQERRENAS